LWNDAIRAGACAADAAMLEQTKNVEKRSARRSGENVVSNPVVANRRPRTPTVEKSGSATVGRVIAAALRQEGRASTKSMG
jgi:hypothetical protein